MPTSPSDPYKSRFVRGVAQQARRWLDRGQTTVRRVQVAASWSAQVLLYPVYALFQAGRLVGKRIERSQQQTRLQELEPQQDDIPLTREGAEFTAEIAIQNVLQTLQTFQLPPNCLVETDEPVTVRAIASMLDSQDLVLITNYNQILTLPDPAQQHWLKQRIIYEIAVYNQQWRSRKLPFQSVRRVLQGIRTTIQRRLAPTPSTALLLSSTTQDLATASSPMDLAPDVPIKRVLWAVRQRLEIAELPTLTRSALKALEGATAIVQAPVAELPSSSKVRIRGVAALLSNRRLVLVSVSNEVLDILTPEQEHLLYQRIAWEVASYRRYLTLRQQAANLAPLRPPAKQSLTLPPVRAFQWLMTWMQSGAVAIAANLFQEASWLACPLPLTEDSTSSAIAPPRLRFQRPRLFSSQRFLPVTKAHTPASNAPASALVQPVSLNSTGELVIAANPIAVLEVDSNVVSFASAHEQMPDYIDTHVTWVNYEQSLFERVMRWLDRCFLWIETVISDLWKSLRQG